MSDNSHDRFCDSEMGQERSVPDVPRSTHTISTLLDEHREGDPQAKDRLVETIYDELKSIARGLLAKELNPEQTLAVTDLVHEAYLRLENSRLFDHAQNRRHLFGSVQRAIRRVLVDRARHRNAHKRSGLLTRISLDEHLDEFESKSQSPFIDLHEALERLESRHPRAAEVVDMRFFGQLKLAQIAELLGVSLSTVEADYRLAREMLREALADSEGCLPFKAKFENSLPLC